jgi:putative transposase
MPDHVHVILTIIDVLPPIYSVNPGKYVNNANVGTSHGMPLPKYRRHELLPRIINSYKSSVTRLIRNQLNDYHFSWQRSYHDHIIRSQREFERTCDYINDNPINWGLKEESIKDLL